jgi:hypothetical protein
VGDFSSDLDLETEEFEKDFLGGDGSLAPFLLLSWEESELESVEKSQLEDFSIAGRIVLRQTSCFGRW